MEKLLDYLGMDAKDAIAFGDAQIDLSMFECCGYSVAMGNASEPLKQAADYVTDDIDADGLLHAFWAFGFGVRETKNNDDCFDLIYDVHVESKRNTKFIVTDAYVKDGKRYIEVVEDGDQ